MPRLFSTVILFLIILKIETFCTLPAVCTSHSHTSLERRKTRLKSGINDVQNTVLGSSEFTSPKSLEWNLIFAAWNYNNKKDRHDFSETIRIKSMLLIWEYVHPNLIVSILYKPGSVVNCSHVKSSTINKSKELETSPQAHILYTEIVSQPILQAYCTKQYRHR